MAEDKARKLVANNKKAYHDYFIEEKYEAGIELFGTEVKSIRQGKCSINRVKKLLLHKTEIRKLDQQKMVQGYTLVPLEVYFKSGRVKVEIGLAKGKKLYDKRADMAKKDQQREAEKEFKMRFK